MKSTDWVALLLNLESGDKILTFVSKVMFSKLFVVRQIIYYPYIEGHANITVS